MQIAAFIKGSASNPTWTGPDVRFWDDGDVSIDGLLTADQLAEVVAKHREVNSNIFQRKLREAQTQPIGVCHDPRPNQGGPNSAPREPFYGLAT